MLLEMEKVMSIVTIYRFEVWHAGEWVLSTRMATRGAIEQDFKGRVLESISQQIDQGRLDKYQSIHLDSWGRPLC